MGKSTKDFSFSVSFVSKQENGVSLYVYESSGVVEERVSSLVKSILNTGKHVSVISNDSSLMSRYFLKVIDFVKLPKQHRKRLEFNKFLYRNKNVDVLIYPDISLLDIEAIKQAKRYAGSCKIYAYCFKDDFEMGKSSKDAPFRTFLELAIKHSESNVILD